jgi:hypothetical protein
MLYGIRYHRPLPVRVRHSAALAHGDEPAATIAIKTMCLSTFFMENSFFSLSLFHAILDT